MMMPLADAIATGPFSIVVEIVASGVKREAQVLEIGSDLATIPAVVAGSIASYADGKVGQDPLRVGAAVRARGLQPNIHLTCAAHDRVAIRQTLREMRALGLFNVFALTGERPAGFDKIENERPAHANRLDAKLSFVCRYEGNAVVGKGLANGRHRPLGKRLAAKLDKCFITAHPARTPADKDERIDIHFAD